MFGREISRPEEGWFGRGSGYSAEGHTPGDRWPEPTGPTASASNRAARVLPMRVLVVDDNPDAAAALALLVELWDYEVRVAHTGFEALAVMADFSPHAILLDIGLPGLSGYETARRIRQHEAILHLPAALLVAVTGYGSSDDIKRAFLSGFDHHLIKPSNPELMERFLQEHSVLTLQQRQR